MTDCCATKKNSQQTFICPECKGSAKPVSARTLLHHLRFPDNLNISNECDYAYCPALNCSVAYFSASNRIDTRQLHSWPLIQQDLLCYCFAISKQQYRAALQSGTAADVKQFVMEQTKNGNCACEVKNSGGHCCLAEFKIIDQQIK